MTVEAALTFRPRDFVFSSIQSHKMDKKTKMTFYALVRQSYVDVLETCGAGFTFSSSLTFDCKWYVIEPVKSIHNFSDVNKNGELG